MVIHETPNIKTKEIPPEYKCSRCKGDMRKVGKNGCGCYKRHEMYFGSKSGRGIIQQNIYYHGNPKW